MKNRKILTPYKVSKKALKAWKKYHKTTICAWTWNKKENHWETECGNKFQFVFGGPETQKLYCPYCSKKIKPMGKIDS